jgi:diadenosine tetraphosphate (Ap4A) HIT family hydrolase
MSYQTFGVLAPHAHIHVVPYFELAENFPDRKTLVPEQATELAKKILAETQF